VNESLAGGLFWRGVKVWEGGDGGRTGGSQKMSQSGEMNDGVDEVCVGGKEGGYRKKRKQAVLVQKSELLIGEL